MPCTFSCSLLKLSLLYEMKQILGVMQGVLNLNPTLFYSVRQTNQIMKARPVLAPSSDATRVKVFFSSFLAASLLEPEIKSF